LNNLQIIADPNTYLLKIKYNETVSFNEQIKINILSCDTNQIKKYTHNNILYCENAICKESCPVGEKAKCIPYYTESINDSNLNTCECSDGWTGESCDIKQYIDFR